MVRHELRAPSGEQGRPSAIHFTLLQTVSLSQFDTARAGYWRWRCRRKAPASDVIRRVGFHCLRSLINFKSVPLPVSVPLPISVPLPQRLKALSSNAQMLFSVSPSRGEECSSKIPSRYMILSLDDDRRSGRSALLHRHSCLESSQAMPDVRT